MTEVPKGWLPERLDHAFRIIMGQSPPSRFYNENGKGLPFYQGKKDFGAKYPTTRIWCSQSSKIAPAGSVLLSVRAPVGASNISQEECCIGRGLAALIPKDETPTEFIHYLILRYEQELDRKGTGTTFKAITKSALSSFEVILPPVELRKPIVSEIEKHFTCLDAAVASLRATKEKLQQYRQSVLKAAFEGRLTENYRNTPRGKESVANIHLDLRMLPNTPTPIDFHLPVQWKLIPLKNVTDIIYRYPTFYGMKRSATGVPVVGVGHITSTGSLIANTDRYWFVSPEVSRRYPKTILQKDDIVMSVRGAVGKIGLVPDEFSDAQISPNCIRISPTQDRIVPRYLFYFMRSPQCQTLLSKLSNATTISTIKASLLSQLSVPYTSTAEQNLIVDILESSFSLTSEIERSVQSSLSESESLRKSILKTAFSGKLIRGLTNEKL